jgi:hypothetical protein
MMGSINRRHNSSRVMKKTVRRERKERKREIQKEVGSLGMKTGIGCITPRNLGASKP